MFNPLKEQRDNKKVNARYRNDYEIEVFNSPPISVYDSISACLSNVLLLTQKLEASTSPNVIARIITNSKEVPFLEFRKGTETTNVVLGKNVYEHEDRGATVFIKLFAITAKGALFVTDFEYKELKSSIYRKAFFINPEEAEKVHRVCYGQYQEAFYKDLTSFVITYLKSLPYPKED